jgi:Ser/Thr protein kinase RdoA (MazF antagonist)
VLDGVLDAFARDVQPVLGSLRRQVLYNDMNTGNTLIDAADHDRLAGIIDFGDLVETAVVIDAAVGATPQVAADMGVTEAIAAFIGGFHAVRPLLAEEVALLPTLVAARFAMALILQVWHRTTHPDNPHYRVVSTDEMARRCDIITAAGSPATLAALRTACGK